MDAREQITAWVHHCYWGRDINCARTTLFCLSELCRLPLHPLISQAAVGLNGAGRTGGQCGLLEGALLFLGILGAASGKTDKETVRLCGQYATAFQQRFGGTDCRELRPGGFRKDDPPHRCEAITVDATCFAWDFVRALK